MRAAGLQDVIAAGIPNRTSVSKRRRTPSQEARLARAAEAVVAEVLEGRRLFAITVSLSGSTLNVSGDTGNNHLFIYQENTVNGDKIGIYDNVAGVRHENDAWLAANISLIFIDANAGNDTIEVEYNGYTPWGDEAVTEPIDMYGGDGADDLFGGDGNDTLNGGQGDDELRGLNGSDTMYGSGGADIFWDSDGSSDTMYGGAGNDTFHSDDDAVDYLDGGADTDTATDRDTGGPWDTTVNIEFS